MENKKLTILQPMKYWWLYFIISLAVIIPGSYSLIRYGLKPSIDFTGGTTIVWDVTTDETFLRQAAKDANIEIRELSNKNNVWTIQTVPLTKELYTDFKQRVKDPKELSYDTVGPSLGSELIRKTLYAILLAASLIYFRARHSTSKMAAMRMRGPD